MLHVQPLLLLHTSVSSFHFFPTYSDFIALFNACVSVVVATFSALVALTHDCIKLLLLVQLVLRSSLLVRILVAMCSAFTCLFQTRIRFYLLRVQNLRLCSTLV